ncbi:MAG: hypothetical protein B7Z37_05780 [Verrucomicrobia bacterium 12-59-8]|nr:MAG: hypothetical protein B7Z37_05780 [Verrucomicrobia bacterium 12-59-8]
MEVSTTLEKALANRLMVEIENGTVAPRLDFLKRAFLIINRCGDSDKLRAWSKKELTRDPMFIIHFASLITNWAYGDDGRQMEWPGDEKAVETAKDYVDTEWLAQTFSPKPPAKSNEWNHSISGEEAAYKLVQLLNNSSQAEISTDEA